MILTGLFLNVLSFLLAVISVLIGFKVFKNIRNWFNKRHIKQLKKASAEKYYDWLLKYYTNKNRKGQKIILYSAEFDKRYEIPFLVKGQKQDFVDISTLREPILAPANSEPKKTRTPKQKKMRKIRKKAGQRIFRSTTLCLDKYTSGDTIYFSECDYYDLAGCMMEYDEETYRAVKNKFARTPLRDKYLSDISKIKDGVNNNRRISLGGSVALCVKNESGYYTLLLQTRSDKVLSDCGKITVVPQFGFEPVPEHITTFSGHKPIEIILYNIVKEICEELFNNVILIRNIKDVCTLDDFGKIPVVNDFKALFEKGAIRIIYLGTGFETICGAQILSFLMIVDDAAFSAKLLNKCQKNWELKDIEHIALSGTGIRCFDQYQQNEQFTLYTSFTLSRMLEWFKKPENCELIAKY